MKLFIIFLFLSFISLSSIKAHANSVNIGKELEKLNSSATLAFEKREYAQAEKLFTQSISLAQSNTENWPPYQYLVLIELARQQQQAAYQWLQKGEAHLQSFRKTLWPEEQDVIDTLAVMVSARRSDKFFSPHKSEYLKEQKELGERLYWHDISLALQESDFAQAQKWLADKDLSSQSLERKIIKDLAFSLGTTVTKERPVLLCLSTRAKKDEKDLGQICTLLNKINHFTKIDEKEWVKTERLFTKSPQRKFLFDVLRANAQKK